MPLEPIPKEGSFTTPCQHPEHYMPTHIYIPPGMQYRHKCPGCGAEMIAANYEVTSLEQLRAPDGCVVVS